MEWPLPSPRGEGLDIAKQVFQLHWVDCTGDGFFIMTSQADLEFFLQSVGIAPGVHGDGMCRSESWPLLIATADELEEQVGSRPINGELQQW